MMPGSIADTRYTLVHLGTTRLLLPQADLRDIEGLDNFSTADVPPGGAGGIQVGRHSYPVYCMSEALSLMVTIPASRRMCVLLQHGEGLFGLLCDQMEVLESHVALQPLPECMRIVDSPVEALVLQSDGLACVSSARHIAACIPSETRQPAGEYA